jgi:hypothetical protein
VVSQEPLDRLAQGLQCGISVVLCQIHVRQPQVHRCVKSLGAIAQALNAA